MRQCRCGQSLFSCLPYNRQLGENTEVRGMDCNQMELPRQASVIPTVIHLSVLSSSVHHPSTRLAEVAGAVHLSGSVAQNTTVPLGRWLQ